MVLEKPELLKEWLVATLRKMCDADPVALGRYILALVKKDKKELKPFLLEQLEIFLLHNTAKFVDLLLDALATKSYLAPQESAKETKNNKDNQVSSSISSNNSTDSTLQPVQSAKTLQSKDSSKVKVKSEIEVKSTSSLTVASHSSARTEKSGVHPKQKSFYNDKNISRTTEPYKPYSTKDNSPKHEYVPTVCKRVSHEDMSESNSKKPKYYDSTLSDGFNETTHYQVIEPMNIENVHKKNVYFNKSRNRCKNYDEKGFCLQGSFCKFDHGNDPILVDNSPDQFLSNLKSVNFNTSLNSEELKEIHEPYNPESPGMNLPPNFNIYSKPPPPIPPYKETSFYSEKRDFYHKPNNDIRNAESIVVDTSYKPSDTIRVTDNITHPKPLNTVNNGICATEAVSYVKQEDSYQRRFDFSRLGPIPRTTLQLGKVPKHLNTITNLHQHFSKFGTIVNIEVAIDNDPEAAIVSFSTNKEATAAYRSTEAVLHNRFIKVFWHNQNSSQKKQVNPKFLKEIQTKDISPPPVPERKVIPLGVSEFNKSKMSNKSGLSTTSRIINKSELFNKSGMSNKMVVDKSFETGDIAAHKVKLHQAKNELLYSRIKHQKIILEQLLKATKKKEKMFLKLTLDTVSKQVEDLTKDLKKENEELKTLLKAAPLVTNTKMAAKELLDAELDLYRKQNTQPDEDTTEFLMKKVQLMKSHAKALGLIENVSHSPKNVYSRNSLGYHKCNSSSFNSIDHRTKKILISGKSSADMDDLRNHFKQFGKIEKFEEHAQGVIVEFNSRAEAESTYFYGNKLGDSLLSFTWFNDAQLSPLAGIEKLQNTNEMEPLKTIVADEEKEDKEDVETRPWRL